jgi:hypothetical protein
MFNLKTNPNELTSANQAVSRTNYEQIAPTRDVVGASFPNGSIHFKFSTQGTKWIIPNRSYFRMRYRLSKFNGDQLERKDNVAPNMGLMANLFQSGEARIGETVVSRCSDYMPQIDALEHRISKSRSWLEGLGGSLNWWQSSFEERKNEVSKDGALENIASNARTRQELGFDAPEQKANRHSIVYAAAAGTLTFAQNASAQALPDLRNIFRVGTYIEILSSLSDPALARIGDPVGRVARINAVAAAVLTVGPDALGSVDAGAADDGRFNFRVYENYELVRRVKSSEMLWQPLCLSWFKINHALCAGNYEVVLNPQTSSQFQKRAIESLVDKDPAADFKFEVVDLYLYVATVESARVDDANYLLDLAETRCQTYDLESSSFTQRNFDVSPSTYALTLALQQKSAGNLTQYSASRFKVQDNIDLSLSRYFIQYAGQSRPSPDSEGKLNGDEDFTVQRYIDSNIYNEAYYDTGGAETIKEWQERGPYYMASWPRDGSDRSTRVNVHLQVDGNTNAAGFPARILLFDHSRKVASVTVQNSQVINVQIEDQ